MKQLIVAAGLSHQHTCAKCRTALQAFGRDEEPGAWSCPACKVPGATIAQPDDPKARS